jgi:pimeloyl-ACP methyl ester carboxylesterase
VGERTVARDQSGIKTTLEAAYEGRALTHATNPADGVRTYFEDSGGAGPPVLFYTGFADPLEVAKASRLAGALRGEFRLIFADHRGQGGSDKPYDATSYILPTRVGDAVAVLDALGIERAHFVGSSWGARLGFALGEHAPERVLSLVLWQPAIFVGVRVADRPRSRCGHLAAETRPRKSGAAVFSSTRGSRQT